jgi:hypothetical protein
VRVSFAEQRGERSSQRTDDLDVDRWLVEFLRRDGFSERLVEPAQRRSIGRIDLDLDLEHELGIDLLVERLELLDHLRRDEGSWDGASG